MNYNTSVDEVLRGCLSVIFVVVSFTMEGFESSVVSNGLFTAVVKGSSLSPVVVLVVATTVLSGVSLVLGPLDELLCTRLGA